MSILIFAVLAVLISSALCSGTEAALFSVPMIKVRQLAEKNKASTRALLKVRENMQRPIATIVILNNIANIVGSIVVGGIATEVLGTKWLGLFSGALTFLVIIFSEIIPKTVGEQYCERISLFTARPLLLLTSFLTPLVWVVEKITSPLTKGKPSFTTNESEIVLMTKIGQTEGVIEQDESEMIQKIFKLNDMRAKDLMTPRVTMTYLHKNATLEESKEAIIASPHSRIIVVDKTPDEVAGVVFKHELLIAMIENKYTSSLKDFIHKVTFVPDHAKADQLLSHFQENRQHIAVAIDEYSGVAGVVTLEDVLEVLTGDIVDETDKVANLREFSRNKIN